MNQSEQMLARQEFTSDEPWLTFEVSN